MNAQRGNLFQRRPPVPKRPRNYVNVRFCTVRRAKCSINERPIVFLLEGSCGDPGCLSYVRHPGGP